MNGPRTVTLSPGTFEVLSRYAADDQRRTDLVEAALTAFLIRPATSDPAQDRRTIDAHAAELNEEALDVLSYQFVP
jgi:hypothetical protein